MTSSSERRSVPAGGRGRGRGLQDQSRYDPRSSCAHLTFGLALQAASSGQDLRSAPTGLRCRVGRTTSRRMRMSAASCGSTWASAKASAEAAAGSASAVMTASMAFSLARPAAVRSCEARLRRVVEPSAWFRRPGRCRSLRRSRLTLGLGRVAAGRRGVCARAPVPARRGGRLLRGRWRGSVPAPSSPCRRWSCGC